MSSRQGHRRPGVLPAGDGGRSPRECVLSSLTFLQEIKPEVERPESIYPKGEGSGGDGCSPGGWGLEWPETTERKEPRDLLCSPRKQAPGALELGAEE